MLDKDKLANALGISKEDRDILDVGSDHHFLCTCETCRQWWLCVGPEDNPGSPYGPFSIEQIEDGTLKGDECKKARLSFEQ